MDARGYTVKHSMKGSRSHEEKRGNHCHRFNVNVTAKRMPEVILLNIALKGLVLTGKNEEITVIGLVLT